jgi:hypothetical protein
MMRCSACRAAAGAGTNPQSHVIFRENFTDELQRKVPTGK